MGKLSRKIILMFLCAALVLIPTVSCSENQENDAGITDKGDATTTTTTTTNVGDIEETRLYPDIPETNLEGFEINFIGNDVSVGAFGIRDVYAEAENGDLLNDAVFKRNQTLEEKYNFTIKFNSVSDATPTSVVKPTILSDDDTYDILYDGVSHMATLAIENMLLDYYELPNINFEQPWWDKNANNDLSLAHKLYFTYGEHMIGSKSGLYCVFFNKKLAADYQLGDLYQYVKDDNWTLDTFGTVAKGRYQDVNNNAKYDTEDVYGFVTEGYNAYTAIVGCGIKIASKDANDLPVLSMNNERGVIAVEAMMNTLGNKDMTIYTNDIAGVNDVWTEFWADCFVNNQILFREGAMHDIPTLRNMNADFGILPMPKLDSNQDRYYHTLSLSSAQMMSIPVTCAEIDKVTLIIEAMACESMYTLTPAYYDQQLKTKAARDNESSEMLDIIFGSKTFDIGAVFDWGGLWQIYTGCAVNRNNTFSSEYAKKEAAALTAMQQTIDSLTK